ncbi:hypothetical protein FA13DRAFT_1462085 [Coprinellus micaceus]|uniref:Uncharacterized protein n=1 Tax=Coprinellus micaceus TaxID=71717 RepID=A0A4Y7SMW0_COPMI|nr:hypothetical protein FA13DRAFT_1462085 [Coprinellus micaceus]
MSCLPVVPIVMHVSLCISISNGNTWCILSDTLVLARDRVPTEATSQNGLFKADAMFALDPVYARLKGPIRCPLWEGGKWPRAYTTKAPKERPHNRLGIQHEAGSGRTAVGSNNVGIAQGERRTKERKDGRVRELYTAVEGSTKQLEFHDDSTTK